MHITKIIQELNLDAVFLWHDKYAIHREPTWLYLWMYVSSL